MAGISVEGGGGGRAGIDAGLSRQAGLGTCGWCKGSSRTPHAHQAARRRAGSSSPHLRLSSTSRLVAKPMQL